jgi:hypothetical protein
MRMGPTLGLAWLLLAACTERTTPAETAGPPVRAQQPKVENDVTVEIRLQFRFKSTGSFEDIDPSRIAPTVEALAFVVRFKIYDDRMSDADFVTLVVELHEPSTQQLTALRDVLVGLPNVQAFAVDRSGEAHVLVDVPIEQLAEVAGTDALADGH